MLAWVSHSFLRLLSLSLPLTLALPILWSHRVDDCRVGFLWLFRACQVWRSYPTTTPHSKPVGPVLHTSWLAYQLHSSRSELRQQLSLHCFQLVACCFSFCSLRRATCTTSLVASSLPPWLPSWLPACLPGCIVTRERGGTESRRDRQTGTLPQPRFRFAVSQIYCQLPAAPTMPKHEAPS